ncbi:MAG: hypothetical protein GY821_07870 [Gammaproteobacteria bacterium]|nr:hypothetical protein [Gammaproteobacteria bacterium]
MKENEKEVLLTSVTKWAGVFYHRPPLEDSSNDSEMDETVKKNISAEDNTKDGVSLAN